MSEEKQHGDVVLYTHNEDEFNVVLNLDNGELYIDRNKFRRTKVSDIVDVGYKVFNALDYSLSRNYLKLLFSNEDDAVKYSDYVGRCKIIFTYEDVYTNFNLAMNNVYNGFKDKKYSKILIISDNTSNKYFFTTTQSKSFGYFVRYSFVDIKVLPTKHDIEQYLTKHKEDLKNTGIVLLLTEYMYNETNDKFINDFENLIVIPLLSDFKHERVRPLVILKSKDELKSYYGFGVNGLNITVLFREKTKEEKDYEDKVEKDMYDKLRQVNIDQLDEKYIKHKEEEQKEKLREKRKKEVAKNMKNKNNKKVKKNVKKRNTNKHKVEEESPLLDIEGLLSKLEDGDENVDLFEFVERIVNNPSAEEDKKNVLKEMIGYDSIQEIKSKMEKGLITKEEAESLANEIIMDNVGHLFNIGSLLDGINIGEIPKENIDILENDVQD